MRIFLSSQQALRAHAVPAYGFWEYYFKQALAEAGHEVLETPGIDWAEGLTQLPEDKRQQWLANTWTPTVDFIRRAHASKPIDLFLGYLFPNQIEPAAVASIRSLGIPCVNFFCDNVREFTRVPTSYHGFDLHWVPEFEARKLYTTAKLPFIYAPMPMWVPPKFRTISERENVPVTFIGSHDLLREELLGDAVARGLPLRLHGAGWQSDAANAVTNRRVNLRDKIANQMLFLHLHGVRGFLMRGTYQLRAKRSNDWIAQCCQPALYGEDYFFASRESEVLIGINRYPSFRHSFSRPGRYSRLRDIEAPMLGACYLTEWAPGIDDLYEAGVEIETYRDAAELVEKSARLHADPARRKELRKRGQSRALNEHTVSRSLSRIATQLGIRP